MSTAGVVTSPPSRWRALLAHPALVFWLAIIAAIVGLSIMAPAIAMYDPLELDPVSRLMPPSAEHLFGTDNLGRDVFSRVLVGSRTTLLIGAGVATLATLGGLILGLTAGLNRVSDAIVMRLMDGLMAVPGILLAIALMSITQGSAGTVIIAIAIPEIPRVVRLVRSMMLAIRERQFVEASVTLGFTWPQVLIREVLPNTLAPLVIQATFIFASAILFEAYLSFLGAGIPPEVPSWGNIIASGRTTVQLALWVVVFPSLAISLLVLAVNQAGDGLRDLLDPQLARRLEK